MPHVVENNILLPEMGRLLAEGKDVRFTPTGVSMRPWIEGGRDAVLLRRVNDDIRVGQVLLCRVGNAFVLHRLRDIEKNGTLVLQGDGNLIGQERCSQQDVLGIVVAVYTPSGHRKFFPQNTCWLRLPRLVRKYALKIYRKIFA